MTACLRRLFLCLLLPSRALLAQDPFGPADPYESRFKVKPNFQIKFKLPEKGGEVLLRTGKVVRFEKDSFWEGSDEVEIEYQDVKMRADRGRFDFSTDTATLEGHVVIDQGPTRLTGTRATFQVKAKTGRLEDATADLPPSYHVVAESIEKIGEATYRIDRGLFTACDLPDPAWSFYMSQAVVTLDDYAHMKNVSFRTFRKVDLPLLYTPYLIWPTKEDRASGLLVPGVRYSSRRGAALELTHYWVTGRSTDLTTALELYSSRSIGLGQEFRWTPSLESAGLFQGYAIHDTEATVCVPEAQEPLGGEGPCRQADGQPGVFARRTRDRWRLRLDHISEDLPLGFRGVVSAREYSDDAYLQDLERSFAQSSSRQIGSRGFLSKNFGDSSVNLRVERTETFVVPKVIQERLPSLEYFRRTSRIGRSPAYFAMDASLSYLYINGGPNQPRGTYGRADLHPTFSLPWKRIPWLSATAKAGGRWTGYTDSTDSLRQRFVDASTTREYGEAGLAIVGPSFSKIYDGQIGPFGKFKHVIEPRAEYEYVSEVDDPTRLPAFDEIDTQLGRSELRYKLINRLLARPADPKLGSAQEIASLELSQIRSIRPAQSLFPAPPSAAAPSKTGPLRSVLRVSPGSLFQFDAQVDYDTRASQVTGTSLTVQASWKTHFLNATYLTTRPVLAAPPPSGISFSPNTDQVRVAAGVDLTKFLRVDTQLNYDAGLNLLREDRTLLSFKGSCYTVFLEVRQLRVPPSPRRDYRFVFNLKDIGTLFDFHGSLDTIFGSAR